jgi:hypothetical protein
VLVFVCQTRIANCKKQGRKKKLETIKGREGIFKENLKVSHVGGNDRRVLGNHPFAWQRRRRGHDQQLFMYCP